MRGPVVRIGRIVWVPLLGVALLAGLVGGVHVAGGRTGVATAQKESVASGTPTGWAGLSGPPAPATGTPSAGAPLPSSPPAPPGPATVATPTVTLRMPGVPPAAGAGTFSYEMTAGTVRGRAGELRRYRVAVENGAGEGTAAFANEVDGALGNPASWTGSGRLRLQRVPAGAAHDFTVYLATARTAREMCAAGWVNIMVGGVPYTSCRARGKVIINLDRWRLSVPHFVSATVPLATYRAYVVNHEVGHELGYRHERCPGRGRPAPVMMQQTLFLRGCLANPWPYLSGRRYAGPPL
ncbi:DUF3152 domain-containing protein [Micromonospora sp. CPCC 206060]|uniref:DUF3152 domain-containing protein n=1 Tax=Micromonospora sp. CPCC 206060 TaxID=3122406 RepID=UPI002FEFF349